MSNPLASTIPRAPFADLARLLPEVALQSHLNGRIVAVNPAAEQLIAEEALAGPLDLLPERHLDLLTECLLLRKPVVFGDARVGNRLLEWTYLPLDDDSGAYLVGCDRTESRRTEALLRISEARHRLLAEQSADIISRHAPDTWEFLYVSPAAQTLLGYRPEELIGVSSLDLFHPDDRLAYQERAPTVAYDRGIYVATYRYRHKDGHYIWLESTSRTLRDPMSGDLLEIISVSRDVSRRVMSERATRRLASIVEATTDLVAFFEGNGRITYLNEAARRALGIPYPENHHLRLYDLLTPESLARVEREGLPQARASGTWSGETTLRKADGQELPVSQLILSHPANEDGVEYFSTCARDISERRHAEELAQRHYAEMAHIARLVTMGEMASGLAHELNQPLAAIVNYARGAIRRIDSQPPASAELLHGAFERIAQQASRAGEIIKRLRGFARKSEFMRRPLNINTVVSDMLRFCQTEARRHNVQLLSELPGSLPDVLGDRVQIEQVLLNLLRNAMEASATEPGSGRRPVVVGSSMLNEEFVVVQVADRGHGLPSDDEQLFEQFYTTKPKGLGLGLSISRSIMEAHGGELWAENNPGGGAIFKFTLPTVS